MDMALPARRAGLADVEGLGRVRSPACQTYPTMTRGQRFTMMMYYGAWEGRAGSVGWPMPWLGATTQWDGVGHVMEHASY